MARSALAIADCSWLVFLLIVFSGPYSWPRYPMTSSRFPRLSVPARTWRMPSDSVTALVTAISMAIVTSNFMCSTMTRIISLSRACDLVMNRCSSWSSRVKALTTRIDDSTSCSTDVAELSSCFTCFHDPLSRPMLERVTRNRIGIAETATTASVGSRRAITYSIAPSVRIDVRNGITPLTAMLWIACASDCSRYIESAVPLVS